MRTSSWQKASLLALSLSAAACATVEDDLAAPPPGDAISDPTADDATELAEDEADARLALRRPVSLRIPTEFKATTSCDALKNSKAPPADLTINQLFACFSDDSHEKLAAAYQKKAARMGRGPADLASFLSINGERPVAGTRLRDLAWGATTRRDERGSGVEPPAGGRLLSNSSGDWGLDPTTCGKSCLSVKLSVLGGQRVMGVSPAWSGSGAGPTDGQRLLDEINPGNFPNYDQDALANPELQGSGCGPTAALNLFEWWNIPVYNGGTKLTSQNARTEYIADRMDTLQGINFTDDEELIDFVTQYPRELYNAGKISGYPGYHYMVDDAAGWKTMLSYVSRGYPVIVLYASGSTSMHWAVIAGYTNGKLRIANANNLTLSDFYAQWHDWAALDWYAAWATDLYVDRDTFVALTGWGNDGSPAPERFASRTSGSSPPGYQSGGNAYTFRYCPGGLGAEGLDVPGWSDPSGNYCLFTQPRAGFTLTPTPSGGAASSKSGATVTVGVTANSALSSFIAANPGARCEFRGYNGSDWTTLVSRRCGSAGALSYSYTNIGRFSKVTFLVHASELARTSWNISVN